MPEEVKPVVEVVEEPVVPQETHEVETAPSPQLKVSAEDQLAAKIREDFERLYGSRMKELQNGFQAIQRVNTRLQQELEQVKKSPTPLPVPSVDTKDPWASIQDGQTWKSEIERLAGEKAQQLFQQQQSLQEAQAELVRQDTIREHWKQHAMTKYPDLGPDGNPNSQVSITFNEVLNEHPEYLRNPFGPRLAMEDMEAKLQEKGIAFSPTPSGNQEVVRRARASAAGTPPSRTTIPASTKVILSKDEMEFCKYHGIDPVSYAKNKQVMESTGSLEVA